MFRVILGFALIIVGLVGGLYVGVWWAFIGGIVQVIEALKAPELSSWELAMGIGKIFFASPIGGVVLVTGVTSGFATIVSGSKK